MASNNSWPSYLTTQYQSGTLYKINVNTSQAYSSQSVRIKCWGIGENVYSNSFNYQISACSQSVCDPAKYSVMSVSSSSISAYQNTGTSNQNTVATYAISQYFNIPDSSCSFTSCNFAKLGSSSAQGTVSSFGSVSYSGSGSTASIRFIINTASTNSDSFYLSCLIPSITASSGICSSSQQYIYSSSMIQISVLNCYTAMTPLSYTYVQNSNSGSQSISVDSSTFIQQADTSQCSLTSCQIIDSSTSAPATFLTLTQGSGTAYTIALATTNIVSSTLIYKCTVNGGATFQSNSFSVSITCTQSICQTGSYSYSGTSSPNSFAAYQNTGTSNQKTQSSVQISQYFSIPSSSCGFSSCSLVSAVGTSTSQGTVSTKVTAAYSGSGSTATVTFTMDTSTVYSSTPLYLSCTVPPTSSTSNGTCAINQFYVYSYNSISFSVNSCYTALTHSAYSFTEGSSATATVFATDFIQLSDSTQCTLTGCSMVDSTTLAVPSYVTLTSSSGLTYNFNFNTATILSANLVFQCSGNGGLTQKSNSFQFQIVCSSSICESGSYSKTGTSNPSTFTTYQYLGTQSSPSQYLFSQPSVSLSQYFNFPSTTCSFSSCTLVSAIGSRTSQGTLNVQFTATISGTGSAQSIVFQMDTATIYSGSLYLSCTVPSSAASGNNCGINQFYVFSSNQIAFSVNSCYTFLTHTGFTYTQSTSATATVLATDFIQLSDSTQCTLTGCSMIDSTTLAVPSYVTMTSSSGLTYNFNFDTANQMSTTLKFKCSGNGGIIQYSNTFSFSITPCVTSICESGSYSYTGTSNPSSFNAYLYFGTQSSPSQYLYSQQSVLLSQYFNFPGSTCSFSSCSLVSAIGSRTAQGTLNTQFTATISGTGSAQSIVFQMNTATTFSGSLYLSCVVSASAASGSACAINQFYVYSSNSVAFTVQNCYTPQTPANIILYQNQGGGSVTQSVALSTIISTIDSACPLSCTISSIPSPLALSSLNSATYQLTANTNSPFTSTQLQYTCQGTGASYNSNSFTFEITACIPSVCSTGYTYSGTSVPSSYSVFQYAGTSNLNTQTAVMISQYFTIPNTCTFTSCQLVTAVGTSTSQGTVSTMVTSTFSSSTVQFTIDTSTEQSQNLYLSCIVPSSPVNYKTCSLAQFYTYSHNSISFDVQSCYSPQTPASYTYKQYYTGGLVSLQIYVSSFITVKDNSCPLTNCILVNSSGTTPYQMKLTTQTSWSYSLVLNTSLEVVQQTQFYQCQGYGGNVKSEQFTFEVGYSCISTSTTIKAPSSIRSLYKIMNQQGKITNLTINNFTSSNSACPIIQHKITVQKSLTSIPTNVKIDEGLTSFTITNKSMGHIAQMYKFYICAEALGGAVLYQLITIQIVNDCNQDYISMNHAIPDSSEQMPNFYKIINFFPVLILNTTSSSPISVDISKRIINEFTSDCPITQYKISYAKINNQKVDNTTFGQYFTLTTSGEFKTLPNIPLSIYNAEVYIQASNGQIWGGDQQQYLIDVTIILDQNQQSNDSLGDILAENHESSQSNKNQSKATSNSTKNTKNTSQNQQIVYSSNYFKDFLLRKKIKTNNNKQNNEVTEAQNIEVVNNCRIKSLVVNNKGQATIKFSEKMNTRFNISWINQSNTIIQVQPQDKRQFETDFNSSKLDLSWVIDSYQNDQMKINLTFNYPLEISPSILQDQLMVVFDQSQSLIKCIQNKTDFQLRDDSISISYNIPKQKIYDSSSYTLQQTSGLFNSSATLAMVLALILMFFGDSSKDHWIVFIRTLQLIITQAMIGIVIPANYLSLLQALATIAFYDILDQYDIWSYIPFLSFQDTDVSIKIINQQMQQIAFNQRIAFYGLGTVTIFLLAYMVRVIIVIILALFASITLEKCLNRNHLKKLSQGLFFNTIISLIMESYLEIIVYGYLNFQTYKQSISQGEILSLIIAAFSISTAITFLPCSISWAILSKNEEQLKSKNFNERWGALFEFLNTKKKMSKFYNLIYLFRRLVIVILWTYEKQNGALLLVSIILLNNLYTIYMAESKAFERKILNQQDLLNEFVVATSLYWKMLYSNMVINLQDQYYFAQMELIYILIYCFFNLVLIVLQTVYKNKKIFIYVYNLVNQKYNIFSQKMNQTQQTKLEAQQQNKIKKNGGLLQKYQQRQLSKMEIKHQSKQRIVDQMQKFFNQNNRQIQPQQKFESHPKKNDKDILQKDKKNKNEKSKYKNLQELCQKHQHIFYNAPLQDCDIILNQDKVSIKGVYQYEVQDKDSYYQVTEKELNFKNKVFMTYFRQNKFLSMEIKKLQYKQFIKDVNHYYRTQIELRKIK